MSVQSSHKLARAGGPDLRKESELGIKISWEAKAAHLDGSVSACRDDVLLIKVDNIDGSSGTENYMNYSAGVPINVLWFPGC